MSEAKTHVIDGKTYVEVERKAKVGDLIVYNYNGISESTPRKVTEVDETVARFNVYCCCEDREEVSGYTHAAYRVLEPVDQAPESIVDIIANLIRRVASLESQLRDTQANVERQGVEISANEHAIDELSHRMNHVEADVELNEEDIRKIGAGVQAPQSGATLLADAFEALAKYERSVGR